MRKPRRTSLGLTGSKISEPDLSGEVIQIPAHWRRTPEAS